MKNAPHKSGRWVFVPVFLLTFTAISLFGQAAHAAQTQDNDNIIIAANYIISDEDMAVKRASGGTAITVSSNQVINSTSTGNSVNVRGNLTNGDISTGSNFGGSGFGSYVMNTGNNSTINSGVSLSILMLQ